MNENEKNVTELNRQIAEILEDADRLINGRTKYHIIDSGNGGYTYQPNEIIVSNVLVITHNAGLFSCFSIALEDIMIYFNVNKRLPDSLIRHSQFMYYKNLPSDTLVPMLFAETDDVIEWQQDVPITFDKVWFQWSDYKLINFEGLKPFINKYFAPSELVLNRVKDLEERYNIDYAKMVGVLYRGNDKQKECSIAPYEMFINKCLDIDNGTPDDLRFLISPDEAEFLDAFNAELPHLGIVPDEWLYMPKDSNTAIFMHLPQDKRPEHALNVLASIIMLSKCKYFVSGAGNMSFWCCLYRGNVDNVHQVREGQWL